MKMLGVIATIALMVNLTTVRASNDDAFYDAVKGCGSLSQTLSALYQLRDYCEKNAGENSVSALGIVKIIPITPAQRQDFCETYHRLAKLCRCY